MDWTPSQRRREHQGLPSLCGEGRTGSPAPQGPRQSPHAPRACTPPASEVPPAFPSTSGSGEALESRPLPWHGSPSFRVKGSRISQRGLSWYSGPLPSGSGIEPTLFCGPRAPRSLSLGDHCPVFTCTLTTPCSRSLQRASGPLLGATLSVLAARPAARRRDVPALLGEAPGNPVLVPLGRPQG